MVVVATFNVENLFARPKAFNTGSWAHGERIVSAYREFNTLIAAQTYSHTSRHRMRRLLVELGVYYENSHGAIQRRFTSRACDRPPRRPTSTAMRRWPACAGCAPAGRNACSSPTSARSPSRSAGWRRRTPAAGLVGGGAGGRSAVAPTGPGWNAPAHHLPGRRRVGRPPGPVRAVRRVRHQRGRAAPLGGALLSHGAARSQ